MIPVNEPLIAPEAKDYLLQCLKSGWVSSAGSYLKQFEEQFAAYLGVKFATTTTSGTSALHLALAALNIGKNDEVIVPDLTIISCALATIYQGAKPVLVDVDPLTGNVNPKEIIKKITKKTRVIMVVHLYGHPADLNPILAIAKKHHLYVVEDAAEAHGALYKGKKVGGIGDVGCFSFYGNKIVTTGEGGMVVTNHKHLIEKARLLKDLAHSPKRRFFHEYIGFNYRMTNLQAALGVAQLSHINEYIEKKRWMASLYQKGLRDIPYLRLPKELSWAKNVYWMYAVLVSRDSPLSKARLRKKLSERGIDTREFFIPLHEQPILKSYLKRGERFPVSADLSKRGFYLPSGLAITKEQIKEVVSAIKEVMGHARK